MTFILEINTEKNDWYKDFCKGKNDNEIHKEMNDLLLLGYIYKSSIYTKDVNLEESRIIESGNVLISNLERNMLNMSNVATNLFEISNKFSSTLSNSTKKGHLAENLLFDILKKNFSDSIVTFVGETNHSGDILIESDNYPMIIIESKFYSSSVPTKEVQKFKQDMIFNQYKYGLMLSFSSGIQKKLKYDIEMFDNDKYIFYCSDIGLDNPDSIIHIINVCRITFKKLLENENRNETSKKLLLDYTFENMTFSLSQLQHLHRDTEKWYNDIIPLFDNMHSNIHTLFQKCSVKYYEEKDKITSIINEFNLTISEFDSNKKISSVSDMFSDIIIHLKHPLHQEIIMYCSYLYHIFKTYDTNKKTQTIDIIFSKDVIITIQKNKAIIKIGNINTNITKTLTIGEVKHMVSYIKN